jgi:paraquat-inducible protein B
LDKDAPGLHLTLTVDALKSISRGMGILYRSITVGSVLDYRLTKDGASIELDALIEPEYAYLVNSSTRFWNASGLDIQGGLSGLKIRTASLSSLILGGIAFYTPDMAATAVKNTQQFRLYSDHQSAHSVGIPVSFAFEEGDGLKEGTAIRYEGIQVGTVTAVALNKTLDGVIVKATLQESARGASRANTQFWLVKPELGLTRSANLGTLLTGEYITFKLDGGKPSFSFNALNAPPVVQQEKRGLNIILTAAQRSSIKEGVTISYRGVVVGKVTGHSLANTADHVRIYANIDRQYAPLVRGNSQFWNASGLDIGFKLFGGAQIKSDSVESILGGGISFATPEVDVMGAQVKEGAVFTLQRHRDDDWEQWRPQIHLALEGEDN